jgi:hypothetical protein
MELGRTRIDPSRAAILVQQYRNAKQLPDLVRMLDELDKATKAKWEERSHIPKEYHQSLPSWPVRDFIRIAELEEKQDIDELMKIVTEARYPGPSFAATTRQSWQGQAAAESLAACGEAGFAAIEEHYAAGKQSGAWLIYAVGNSDVSRSSSWLRDYAWKQTNWQRVQEATNAFWLKGEEGLAELQSMAGPLLDLPSDAARAVLAQKVPGPERNVRWSAFLSLKEFPERRPRTRDWPPPPIGSLPTVLPVQSESD